MGKITLQVEPDESSGWYVAFWDAPGGEGGITTQTRDLQELQANVQEAVRCHFDKGNMPREIQLHFVADPILTTA
ncbi:MAG TPA: 2-oxoisovalerate dehydrogenase [Verrucomicrobiae bacterium]|nr:2-oxoisovalerate dehydrogenase [Verrucomicrobiae bacterium]